MTALTKTRLMMGVNYTKTITLETYGNAEIKVKPISDVGLSEIQSRIDYGIFDAIKDFANMGLSNSDISAMMENKNNKNKLDMTKLAGMNISPRLAVYMAELCKKGIVPEPDPDCPVCHGHPKEPVCSACDIRNSVDDMMGFSTFEIGAVILELSLADWKDIEDFFSHQRAQSTPEPSPSPA